MRQPRRRAVATLLAAGLAVSPVCLGLPPATATAPLDTLPIAVTLTTLQPIAPQPGDTLVVRGILTNTSAEPVSGLAVQLRMGGALSARSTFDAYAANPTGSVSQLPISLTGAQPPPAVALGPGQHESFRLESVLNPATTGLPSSGWQVRELGVAITGLTSFGAGTVGTLRSFLPWAPRNTIGPKPLQVAWLWPLVDRPHRGSTSVWNDNALATELAPNG
ncbi:MAG: hypothetical protein ACTHK4_09560, partial [Mycobacteriales bacterium]